MGHGKAAFHSGKGKSPYCPFKKFCIFLNGESPDAILADRDYLRNRVDELEFSMDIANWQTVKLQARVKELENDKSKLEKDLSEALQAPFKKAEKKEKPENPKKRGAPVGHPGWFRAKPEQADKTVDVYLDACPLCGGKNISPCNHTTEHIQEDFEDGRLTSTCFVHCYYWCCDCKSIIHGWGNNEIPNAFIGPDARAKAAYVRYEARASYNSTLEILQCLCGLKIATGSLVGFDHKFAEKATPVYESLK